MKKSTANPAFVFALVALLMALMTLAAPFGSPYIDTARDVHAAWRIATGAGWPLLGPAIGYFTYLGPVWFYLLAAPVWLTSSYTGTALFVALIGSLKFPLAFYLGSRWLDWRLGLLWAGLLAWPGLWMYSLFTFSHFSVVETAVLVFALLAWLDWQRPTVPRAFATGIAFGLMLHAHPTTLLFGIILPVLWWRRGTRRAFRAIAYTVGCAVLLLPLAFAGPVGSPVAGTDTGIGPIIDYLRNLATPDSLGEGLVLWWNTLVLGGEAAVHLMAAGRDWSLIVSTVLLAGLVLLLVVSVLGAAASMPFGNRKVGNLPDRRLSGIGERIHRTRWMVIAGVLGSVAFATVVAWMRAETAWYWMLGMSPLATAGLAALLWTLPVRHWRPLAITWVLAGGVLFLSLLLSGFWATAQDGSSRHFPGGLMTDLKRPSRAVTEHALPWLSFAATDRLGWRLCEEAAPVVLHGALGFILETLGETPSAIRCGRDADLFVAGRGEHRDTRNWLGLGPRIHQALDIPVEAWIGPVALFENARAVYPDTAVPVASAGTYLARHLDRAPLQSVTLEFRARGSERLVISNVFYWWAAMEISSVEVSGKPATLTASDDITRLYACPECSPNDPTIWRLQLRINPNLPPDILFLDRQTKA